MATAQQEVAAPRVRRRTNERPATATMAIPEAAQPMQIDWGYVVNISLIHALSLLILLPWFFSWTGVVVAVLGFPFYGLLGITLCYHRILTHQGLTVPKWLERTLALIGVCC